MKKLSDFPELIAQIHPTLNGDIDPVNFGGSSNKKIWFFRKECGHEWEASIYNRTRIKSGCPYCANQKVCKENCLETKFPHIAKELHPTKNGNITSNLIICGSNKKFWWLCPIGHEYEAICISRTRQNSGCPYCSNRKVCKENCLLNLFPKIAAEWHPTKNGTLTPEMVIAGSNKKFWWKCLKERHEWQSSVNNRTSHGRSCPICKESKGEKIIREYLNENKIEYDWQFRFKQYDVIKNQPFDFVVQKNGKICVIEYQGRQHYIPCSFGSKIPGGDVKNLLEVISRDYKKRTFCKEHNIQLLEIPYWNKDNISEILNCWFADKKFKISKPPKIVKKYKAQVQNILNSIM